MEKAGVPPELQEFAFKEAVSFLREGLGAPSAGGAAQEHSSSGKAGESAKASRDQHDGSSFFAHLAHESGVSETDLRDVLRLADDKKVMVTPATRTLGSNKSEQARTVISLVASARGIGLRESPVNAEHVREELRRKGCYDRSNFARTHLGPLKGFNAGDRNQIILTSKWVDDFGTAIAKAHGRQAPGAES